LAYDYEEFVGDPVCVIWLDAYMDFEEQDQKLCMTKTYGELQPSQDPYLIVVGEVSPEGRRAVTHIPHAIVKRVVRLSVEG